MDVARADGLLARRRVGHAADRGPEQRRGLGLLLRALPQPAAQALGISLAMATNAFDQALAAVSGGGGAGEEEASATREERLGRMQLLKDAARRGQAAAEERL